LGNAAAEQIVALRNLALAAAAEYAGSSRRQLQDGSKFDASADMRAFDTFEKCATILSVVPKPLYPSFNLRATVRALAST
jgi:hypothetical protein